jgi:hypothetical protein
VFGRENLDSKGGGHWFLLDLSMGRDLGVTLWGKELKEVFGEIPREWVSEAGMHSMQWHGEHGGGHVNGILNACRGWMWVVEGKWGSKRDGGMWVLDMLGGDRKRVGDGESD